MPQVTRTLPYINGIPDHIKRLPISQDGFIVPVTALPNVNAQILPEFNKVGEFGKAAYTCFKQGLCGVCGDALDHENAWVVFYPGDEREADGTIAVSEPAMHGSCLAYSVKACPVLNGRLAADARQRTPETYYLARLHCDPIDLAEDDRLIVAFTDLSEFHRFEYGQLTAFEESDLSQILVSNYSLPGVE